MPHRRITMADVARAAKVHQTTVSLALRNDPRLPGTTRSRIRALAEGMGYRPDPMLAALNFYRTTRDAAKTKPSMAFIMRSRATLAAVNFLVDDQMLVGARRAAERMGYRIVPLQIEPTITEGARLSRVIRSRGIDGVILNTLDISLRGLEMDWDHFSALCIESQHLGLSLHTVANNQSNSTRTAVRRLFELGYRRIGLAVGELEETSLGKPFTSGYLIEMHEHPELRSIRPLLLQIVPDSVNAAKMGAWVRAHKIDAVLSNWSSVPQILKLAGLPVPRAVGVATLDYNAQQGPFAGIRQSHELVGERAVEALALLMKTHQRGLIGLPNTTLIDGVWQDGPELPPKNIKAAKRAASAVKSPRQQDNGQAVAKQLLQKKAQRG